jgi:ABC-2 type transport system permease protein
LSKFTTVIKHEYLKRVGTKGFIASTVLGPVLMIGLPLVPILLATLDLRQTTRLAVVDQSGKMYQRVRETIEKRQGMRSGKRIEDSSVSYKTEEARLDGRTLDQVKRELSERVRQGHIDGFLVLPEDVLDSGSIEHYGRNVDDFASNVQLDEYLTRALIDQRMVEANVDYNLVRQLTRDVSTRRVKISEQGEEPGAGGRFFFVIGLGVLLMITVLTYGGMILSAVIEDKESRLVELLFYSIRPFPLMMGKLIGVSLVAFTQYLIWALLGVAVVLVSGSFLTSMPIGASLPGISGPLLGYLLLFFLIGYYVYATLYTLIGAISNSQEDAQAFALPAAAPLVIAVSMVVPVIRNPNSTFSFWVSMFPLFSPVTMPVRIITQTPPAWEIALSSFLGIAFVVFLIWVASRVYRIGMLMYGKRISVAEVIRWSRRRC